jgi:hypothetical protein
MLGLCTVAGQRIDNLRVAATLTMVLVSGGKTPRVSARAGNSAVAPLRLLPSRVVVPLVNKSSLGKITNPRFNPTFRIKDQSVVLHPLDIVSVATENLGLNRPAATHARPRRRDLAQIAAEPDAEQVLRASGIILTSSM